MKMIMMGRYLIAVRRREEKERKIARISPQAAAQPQEGGPAKFSGLLKVTWKVFLKIS